MMSPEGLPVCPYPGLQPFTEKERDFFWGRENDRRIVAANLLTAPLTVLYGPSGVGKSSLLRAAVAPDLQAFRHTAVVVFSQWSSPTFFEQLKSDCLAAVGEGAASIDPAQPFDEVGEGQALALVRSSLDREE